MVVGIIATHVVNNECSFVGVAIVVVIIVNVALPSQIPIGFSIVGVAVVVESVKITIANYQHPG